MADLFDNPMGLMGFEFVEFASPTPNAIEPVLEAAWAHGARHAGYTLLRLPWEVKDIFKDWLERHYPLKAAHVMSRVHQMRAGRDNDPCFGSRMSGTGELARLLEKRFEIARKRIGYKPRERDPGFWLIAEGRPRLERAISFRPSLRDLPNRISFTVGAADYVAAIAFTSALLLAIPLAVVLWFLRPRAPSIKPRFRKDA